MERAPSSLIRSPFGDEREIGQVKMYQQPSEKDSPSPPTVDTHMEVSSNTDDTSVAVQPQPPRMKRKLSDPSFSSPQSHEQGQNADGHKKARLLSAVNHKLPPEVWHYVLALLSPLDLANASRVNRDFHTFLTRSSPDEISPAEGRPAGTLRPMSPEAIWNSSRRIFFPESPSKPLRNGSEKSMWDLILGTHCQKCGKKGYPQKTDQKYDYPWEPPIDADSVQIIWPYGTRLCGSCLFKESEKETEILISSRVPFVLLAALPSLLVTPSKNVITPALLQAANPPPNVQLTKLFFKADVDDVLQRFNEVKSLGPAATEEWIKGLEGQGKARTSDACRWERWYLAGGASSVSGLSQVEALRSLRISAASNTGSSFEPQQYATMPARQSSDMRDSQHAFETGNHIRNAAKPVSHEISRTLSSLARKFHALPLFMHLTLKTLPPASVGHSATSLSPTLNGFGHPPFGPHQQVRIERSVREVNELKAARRNEIERRCLELDPPIHSNVLNHMDSFQAALKISTPMTDSAWEVLRPRLLSQREAAERKEDERLEQTRQLQVKFEDRKQQEASVKEQKELLDKEWEEVQTPVRDRLGLYADEIIKSNWANGDSVSSETSPKFAAEVLIYVRKRYYDEMKREFGDLASRGQEAKQESPDLRPARRLILENMKWVFDSKIKPLTEPYRKELFLCNGCEHNSRFYGFEGVVQHFAAKHTSSLSLGSIVVHWKVEWPEATPFNPDPSKAKMAFYAIPSAPSSGHTQAPFNPAIYSQSPGPIPPASLHQPQGYPTFSPSPFGPRYGGAEQRPVHQYGPFAPPPIHPGAGNFAGPNPGFQGQHFHGPSYPGYPDSQAGFNGTNPSGQGYQAQQPQNFGSPLLSHEFASLSHGPVQGPAPGFGPAGVIGNPYGPHQYIGPPPGLAGPGDSLGLYSTQRDEMVALARGVWFRTSGIKDLHNSIRIVVLIHHVVSQFYAKFSNEPSLNMFADGLGEHPVMKPIRNVSGLACKICADDTALRGQNGGRPRYYNLSTLLQHFRDSHTQGAVFPSAMPVGMPPSRPDWKVDMVQLPPESMISELIHAHGMDNQKLQLFAQVFPRAFPRPLPILGPATNTGPVAVMDDAPTTEHRPERLAHGETRGNATRTPGSDHQHYHQNRDPSMYDRRSPRDSGLSSPRVHSASDRRRNEYDDAQILRGEFHEKHRHTTQSRSRLYHDKYAPDASYGESRSRSSQNPGTIIDDHRAREYRYQGESEGPWDSESQPGVRNLRPEGPMPRSSEPLHGPTSSLHPPIPNPGRSSSNAHSSSASRRDTPRNANHGDFHNRVAPTPAFGPSNSSRHAADEGSEDGELPAGTADAHKSRRGESPPEEVSAAERFLNNFIPGEDVKAYEMKAVEPKRRKEEHLKARLVSDHEAEKHSASSGEESSDLWPRWGSLGIPRTENASGPHSPIHPVPNPPGVEINARTAIRNEELSHSTEKYHAHRMGTNHDDPHRIDGTKRPRSRYERYESHRLNQPRGRPRSPRTSDNGPYLRQSPGQVGFQSTLPARSPGPIPRDHPPGDIRMEYLGEHASRRYYPVADDLQGYAESHDPPDEYMHRTQARPPAHRSYIVYGPDVHERTVYDNNRQQYRVRQSLHPTSEDVLERSS
ncbi:MAG: hypothetical protein M1825_006253 [Sarcosagium campestre]|nr:MAG: hypothetical protein M1825_006253 [Sarcosagium campestre]